MTLAQGTDPTSREAALRLDAADPLAPMRERFDLPGGVIYLDGNSLGPLPRGAPARVAQVVQEEWGRGLIRSWNGAGWIDLPARLGDKIARLIGAEPGEVIVADSTSVNLFKVLAAALTMRRDRGVIVSEPANFPTDLYITQGLIDLLGRLHRLRLAEPDALAGAIDADAAAVVLTHVNYRTGRMHDMAAITRRAHAAGALAIWDLAHSAGALPIDVNAAGVDFAIGCGYKYLNGGPGAPAFVYVARRHHDAFRQPLSGWFSHVRPFDFDSNYRPADGIARALCGTPPVISLAALECGVDVALQADLGAVRAKSLALTDMFIAAVEQLCGGHDLQLVTPREHAQRGSQVCFAHPEAHAVMRALIARGVIGDYRAPDILRFGFAPLYVRYVDAWDAARSLTDVLVFPSQ